MHTATEHHLAAPDRDGGSSTPCPTCEIAPFARNNYFTGKLMLERDFTDEQRYHIDKLRLHNQRLHGWGVVCGLKVVADTNPACRDRYVTVQPGLAIDCCGHEIVVREEVRVDITRLTSYAALTAPGAPAARPLQLCIRYRECGSETIPILYDDCAWDNDRCAPNRILESYDFDLLGPDEKPVGHGHDHGATLGLLHTIRIDRATRLAASVASDRMYVATGPVPGSTSAGDLFQLALSSETIVSAADLEGEAAGLGVSPDGTRVYVLRGDGANPPMAWADVYDATAIDEEPVRSVNLDSPLGDHAGLAVTPGGVVVALANATLITLDASLALLERTKVAGARCLAAGISDEVVYVGADAGVVVSADCAVQPLATTPVITLAGAPAVLDIAVTEGQPDAGGGAVPDDLVAVTNADDVVLVSAGAEIGTAAVAAGASQLGSAADGRRAVVAGTAGVQIVNLVQLRSGSAAVRAPIVVGDGIADGRGDIVVGDDLVYVAYPGVPPAAGGVAVLGTIGALDCDDLLWNSMESCPSCDDPGCIVLATMLDYDAGDLLVDKGTAALGSTEVEIDNRLGRSLLPSTQTLTELIECLLVQPTGPGGTGRDGIDGVDGRDGQDGRDGRDGVDGSDGADGQDGIDGQDGEGLEAGLVQIRAISWLHRGTSPVIDIVDPNEDRQGFAIGFTGKVRSIGLDDRVFRVHIDHTSGNDRELGLRCQCELRGEVVPIEPVYDGDRIAKGNRLPAGSEAEGLAFLLREGLFEQLVKDGLVDTMIELHGDFVLDDAEKARAIDAEFVRAEFPTGDRPAGSDVGVQGGVFESWFRLGREFVDPDAGRLNVVNRRTIESVPGIGRTLATRIVNERRVAPFVDEADFLERIKPSDRLWNLMRDHLDFTPPEA